MNKELFNKSRKMSPEELREYLKIMRRYNIVPAKKGKGAKYNRAKEKRGGQE